MQWVDQDVLGRSVQGAPDALVRVTQPTPHRTSWRQARKNQGTPPSDSHNQGPQIHGADPSHGLMQAAAACRRCSGCSSMSDSPTVWLLSLLLKACLPPPGQPSLPLCSTRCWHGQRRACRHERHATPTAAAAGQASRHHHHSCWHRLGGCHCQPHAQCPACCYLVGVYLRHVCRPYCSLACEGMPLLMPRSLCAGGRVTTDRAVMKLCVFAGPHLREHLRKRWRKLRERINGEALDVWTGQTGEGRGRGSSPHSVSGQVCLVQEQKMVWACVWQDGYHRGHTTPAVRCNTQASGRTWRTVPLLPVQLVQLVEHTHACWRPLTGCCLCSYVLHAPCLNLQPQTLNLYVPHTHPCSPPVV